MFAKHLGPYGDWDSISLPSSIMYNSIMYTIDIFTQSYSGTQFPENTYEVDTQSELLKIVTDCLRPSAGISEIQIFIN